MPVRALSCLMWAHVSVRSQCAALCWRGTLKFQAAWSGSDTALVSELAMLPLADTRMYASDSSDFFVFVDGQTISRL